MLIFNQYQMLIIFFLNFEVNLIKNLDKYIKKETALF